MKFTKEAKDLNTEKYKALLEEMKDTVNGKALCAHG